MNNMQEIILPIEKEFEEFKMLFHSSLQSSNSLLNQVLTHIRQRSGKMMRPILTLLMAQMAGKINISTYHAALSLELLHTASLVHDDVVDESDKRRGQRSVNAIFDNKVSVLVGDFILATSLQHSAFTQNVHVVDLVARLGKNLSEGEIIQLTSTHSSSFSEDVYYEVIRKKTAALFIASAEAGALSVGATEDFIHMAALFGEKLGIAFQIKDDIFDYYSDDIGKPTGNDMREGKLTLPALYVLNQFKDEQMCSLAAKIRSLDATNDEIELFVNYVKQNGGIEYAEQCMLSYRDQALALLPESVPASLRTALTSYIDFVVMRKI